MNNEEAKELLIKYNAGACTETEMALIEDWFLNYNEHEIDLSQERIEEIGRQIYNVLPIHKEGSTKSRSKLWPFIITAAAVIAISASTWLYFNKIEFPIHNKIVHDIAPGGNKATLTLDNGKTINLNDTKTGVVIDANNLAYNDGTVIASAKNSKSVGYHTLSTPIGGQYQIVLPDGTKVWLNSASSLKFPASFNGLPNRKVILTGEAYFEVVKDSKHPFAVLFARQEVEVIGTHFNINSYDEANTKTTLLEGSVKVIGNKFIDNSPAKILKPNEQAIYSNESFNIKNVDTDVEVAWKNGNTEFEDADLKTIMTMLERWYDVDVIYEGKPVTARFTGSVSRSRNISEVLTFLQSTGAVHFKVEGRRVIAMN